MKTAIVKVSQPHDVRIDRDTEWGNPFHIGVHGDRAEVIRKYARWIVTQPKLMAKVGKLYGKRLGCHCAPLPCHGDVLAALADPAPPFQSIAHYWKYSPYHSYWWIPSRCAMEELWSPGAFAANAAHPDRVQITPETTDPIIRAAYLDWMTKEL